MQILGWASNNVIHRSGGISFHASAIKGRFPIMSQWKAVRFLCFIHIPTLQIGSIFRVGLLEHSDRGVEKIPNSAANGLPGLYRLSLRHIQRGNETVEKQKS